MNIAIEIGRIFDLELRRMERQHADAEGRAEWIAERAATLADAMARSPAADRALREALESDEFNDTILDILHAMLWRPALASTAKMVGDLKARLHDLAVVDCNIYDAALRQATEEIDHPEGYVPCDDDFDFGGAA